MAFMAGSFLVILPFAAVSLAVPIYSAAELTKLTVYRNMGLESAI